jgi:hypothetical protein
LGLDLGAACGVPEHKDHCDHDNGENDDPEEEAGDFFGREWRHFVPPQYVLGCRIGVLRLAGLPFFGCRREGWRYILNKEGAHTNKDCLVRGCFPMLSGLAGVKEPGVFEGYAPIRDLFKLRRDTVGFAFFDP